MGKRDEKNEKTCTEQVFSLIINSRAASIFINEWKFGKEMSDL